MDAEASVLILYTGGTLGMLRSDKGFTPHPGFLASNLRSQARFHDEDSTSIFANSKSVSAYDNWTLAEASRSSRSSSPVPIGGRTPIPTFTVRTSSGTTEVPTLITPVTGQGKRIRYAIHEYTPLIDSAEVELTDWIRLATDIELNYRYFDAFVILHGTDTMAYSASALSFLLEDLGKTVIITGAQIPLSELLNDAIDNLLGALLLAGHYRIPEVCLFFDHKLLRGNRSIKASSDEFNAFASPSLPPLATVGIEIDVAWSEVLRPGLRPFRAHKALSANVATLRIFPGISAKSIRAFLSAGDIQGVVLETYGAGNAPRKEELLSAFREASERGVVIVNVSQCATGAVAPDIYETGRALAAVGITGGADLTTEAALAKLSYLLSKQELNPAQVRKLIGIPLRGELTPGPSQTSFSSPVEADERLRTLFAQVIECAPPTVRGSQRTRSYSGSGTLSMSPSDNLPAEFLQPWPASQRDAAAAERALLPFLLGEAASRSDSTLLSSLITSLATPCGQSLPVDAAPPSAVVVLNQPSTPSLQTSLHLAVLAGQVGNVDLLLAEGASVHARDVLSHGVLFYAARFGGPLGKAMVASLKNAGAHFGEVEIERGDVGLEVARASKGDAASLELWKTACGNDLDRAKRALKGLVEGL